MGRKKHSNRISKDAGPADSAPGPLTMSYKPRLIHPLTYQTLVETFLRFVPQDRNVFISMCDYELSTINPTYRNVREAPTHIMIFAVRLIRSNTCQPIGGLLTYDYVDQSAVIAECLKVYITDLAVLGINVVGTVSRSSRIYKRILRHLVKDKDFSSYAITYSVPPFNDLVHIYDFAYITVMFQRQFRHSVIIKFVKDYQLMGASWDDILITLTSTNLFKPHINEALYNNLDIGFNIFTSEFANKFNHCRKKNMLTETQDTTWEIVVNIIKFTAILETDRLYVRQLKSVHNSLFELQKILYGVSFRKNRGVDYSPNTDDRIEDNELTVSISTSTEDESCNSIKSIDEEIETKRIDFEDDPPIEIEDNCMQNILNLIDSSIETKDVDKQSTHKSASVLTTKRRVKTEKLTEKVNNRPYEKPPINYRKRKTKEELKIDMLEKNFISIDLQDKENVEKNNEKNKDPRKKNKITNLLMEYLHSEGYKNLEKSELAPKITSENDLKSLSINSVRNESQATDNMNNLPKSNNTTGNFSFDNFTFDVKTMPDFVDNYLCRKRDSDSSEQDDSEPKSRSKPDFKPLYSGDSNFNAIPYVSGEGTTVDPTKAYISCDNRPHPPHRKCNVCLLRRIKEDDFEEDEVSLDWLTVIGGLSLLSDSLDSRRVKYVVPFVFTLEHTDYFVSLIQEKNGVPSTYGGRDYKFLDRESAFQTLENDVGLYLIKKD